jgi:hypothetical protein
MNTVSPDLHAISLLHGFIITWDNLRCDAMFRRKWTREFRWTRAIYGPRRELSLNWTRRRKMLVVLNSSSFQAELPSVPSIGICDSGVQLQFWRCQPSSRRRDILQQTCLPRPNNCLFFFCGLFNDAVSNSAMHYRMVGWLALNELEYI